MTTSSRRLLGLLLVPLLGFGLLACTDSGDDGADGPTTEPSGDATEFTFRALDPGGPLTVAALEAGDVDIAVLFSSNGAIAANGWVALEDDQDLQPADNFAPAIRTEASNPEIEAVLDEVSAALTASDVQELVAAVSIDGDNPEVVAGAWLTDNDLPGDLTAEGSLTVGSANFPESSIVAQIYGQALAAAGVDIDYTPEIGARDVYFAALENGEIDLVPEFIGTLLAFVSDNEIEATPDVEETLGELRPLAEARGVSILAPSPADSVNTFVVTAETAEQHDLATVSDLADVEEPLVLGGPPECPERPYCLLGLVDTYGLSFAS